MSFGLAQEHGPEIGVQVVGLAVQQSIDEACTVTGVKVDGRCAGDALQLVDHQFQRVSPRFRWSGNGIGPVGCQHEDAAGCQAAAQVKE